MLSHTTLKNTLRITGTAVALSLTLGSLAVPNAHATANEPAPAKAASTFLQVPYGNIPFPQLPPLQHLKPKHDLFLNPVYFKYFDWYRGWGILCFDYQKYNEGTDTKLMKVKYYYQEKVWDRWQGWIYKWVCVEGSGSYQVCRGQWGTITDKSYSFTLYLDKLGKLFFECKPDKWGTYHIVGHPKYPPPGSGMEYNPNTYAGQYPRPFYISPITD